MTNEEVRTRRLGNVLSDANLAQLAEALNRVELPVLPIDITPAEAQELLAYHGSFIAFLSREFYAKNAEVQNAKIGVEQATMLASKEIHDANHNLKATDVKIIAANSPVVKDAQEALKVAQTELGKIQGALEGLKEQNVSLRKIASMMQASADSGIA